MVEAWHGHGMASVNQTRPHCVNQMGKTHSKPLAARHGRGKAWARHGNGMQYLNRPLEWYSQLNVATMEFNIALRQRRTAYVPSYIELSPVMRVTFRNGMLSHDKERLTSMHELQFLGLHKEMYFHWSHFMIGNKLYEVGYKVN